ncbi:MAG: hypothetical protein IPK83_20105 [Planctomycetes bacterium]|nr:hypothetical protein [Planctomycetota bacterium]
MLRHLVLTSLLLFSVLFPAMGTDCAGTVPGTSDNIDDNAVTPNDDTPSNANDNVNANQTNENDDAEPDNQNDNSEPSTTDGDSAVRQAVEFLNSKVLTEISTSSNIGDISFIEHFRGDLELCSNKSFTYFEFKETTIGSVFSRKEFSATGTWDVRIDSQSNGAILILNFQAVSEGEPFTSEPTIDQNAAGETFLGETRVFVTDGDDLCE